MRSSTGRALAQLNQGLAVDPSEKESLLTDYDSDQDVELIVDTQERRYPPRQADSLRDLLQQVDALQPVAATKAQRRVSRFYLYAVLVLGGLTTLLTAPAVGLYFFVRHLYDSFTIDDPHYLSYQADLPVHETEMAEFQQHLQDELSQADELMTERDGVLMPYYKQWWQYDDTNTNCNLANDPHPEKGRAELQAIVDGKKHPLNHFFARQRENQLSNRCQDIASHGVAVEDQHADLLKQISLHIDAAQHIKDRISDLVDYIRADKLLMSSYETSGLVASLSVGLIFGFAIIGGVGFLGRLALIAGSAAKSDLDQEKIHLKSIGPNVSAELMSELEGVSVSLQLQATVALTDLSLELTERIAESEARASKRAAFLSGKKYAESGLFAFLNTSGHKETTKLIFAHADLLPRP